MRGAELKGGRIQWNWKRADASADGMMSGRFWTIRLPLGSQRKTLGYINLYRAFDSVDLQVDINYICSAFQRELSAAAERVFDACKEESRSAGISATLTAGKASG